MVNPGRNERVRRPQGLFPAEPSRQAGNGGKNAERKLEPRLENLERIHQAEKDESERQNIGRMPLSAQHERQKPD